MLVYKNGVGPRAYEALDFGANAPPASIGRTDIVRNEDAKVSKVPASPAMIKPELLA
jgi:hypothetical protein